MSTNKDKTFTQQLNRLSRDLHDLGMTRNYGKDHTLERKDYEAIEQAAQIVTRYAALVGAAESAASTFDSLEQFFNPELRDRG